MDSVAAHKCVGQNAMVSMIGAGAGAGAGYDVTDDHDYHYDSYYQP